MDENRRWMDGIYDRNGIWMDSCQRGPGSFVRSYGASHSSLISHQGESRETFLGELSYPIYIVHILVKWIILGVSGVQQSWRKESCGNCLAGGIGVGRNRNRKTR